LLEVQEVLAEREFEIGRFYYLRTSYPASIARLRSLMEKYPLYSKADEALYLLGQDYEGEIARVRAAPTCTAPGKPPGCATEAMKSQLIAGPTKSAAEAYSQIITRYPIMDRVDDARKRLAALHQPIPRPTKAAVAQNKAEDASRHETTMFGKLMGVVRKGPDVAQATKIGDPSLTDPTPVSAQDVTHQQLQSLMGPAKGEKSLSVEKVDASGVPAANEPVPRSDTPAPAAGSPFAQPTAPAADPNELTPTAAAAAPAANTAPDPNELKPNADASGAAALPPPPQVNEIQQGPAGAQASSSSSSATAASDANALATDKDLSSSKKKKKKGLKKIVPF
jgi:outer membrane protein assembly factor BamD